MKRKNLNITTKDEKEIEYKNWKKRHNGYLFSNIVNKTCPKLKKKEFHKSNKIIKTSIYNVNMFLSVTIYKWKY